MSIWNNISTTLSNLYNTLFSGSGSQAIPNDHRRRSSPRNTDLTFNEIVNTDLTRALWHNSQPGFKLAAQIFYNIIALPLAFMKFPHYDIDDWKKVDNKKFWEEKFKFYNKTLINEKKTTQLMCHRDGTILKWPWFDSRINHVRIRTIKPEEISQVTTDPDTEEPTSITTSIRYNFYGENGKLYNYLEERTYTKKLIMIKRTGNVPSNINNEDIRKNVLGILPIVFANNKEPGEFFGHSDYERVIPLGKAYSTVLQKACQNDQKHGPKLVQNTTNPKTWKSNNEHLFDADGHIDISSVDYILNTIDESTNFSVPTGLNANAETLLILLFHNSVEVSGIPEIWWGLKTKGNHASAKEQFSVGLAYVENKQDQNDTPALELLIAIMSLEAIANNRRVPVGMKTVWNELTSLTEEEKAVIFKDYATGLEKLLANFAIDLQSAHKILSELTGGMITSNYDDFEKQIREYGGLRAWAEQDYAIQRETNGETQEENKQENAVARAINELTKPTEAMKQALNKMGIKTQQEVSRNGTKVKG